MAIPLPDARQLSDEVLEALRGCELGFSEADVAELLGVSRETVSRWWTAYAAGGLEAIPGDRTGRPVGTGRTLSDEQARRIQDLIDGHSPGEMGIAAAVWSRKAVRDLIRAECGIDMPVRTVGEYLKRWGYTAKVPRRHAKDQDPDEVAEWLDETYPAIEERAALEGAEIHGCDETGARADEQPRKGYAREGDPAWVEVPKPHIRVNRVATITNPDPGSPDGARGEGGRRLGGGARRPDRAVLAAEVRPGAERGGVPEQRPEGGDRRGGPAGEPGGATVADQVVHEPTAPSPGARAQLLLPPLCSVCRR